MKLRIRQKDGLKFPIYIPNRLILWIIQRKIPGYAMDNRKFLKLLRQYRGMTILECEEHTGDYVRIKL